MQIIEYECPVDHSFQKAKFRAAEGNLNEAKPLVVALHTWSQNYDTDCSGYETICKELNFHLIYPDFRGPNWTYQALGSDLVIADIKAAVEYCCKNYCVDMSRIYLIGGSGGGHASLLLAARLPEVWAGVSSWCPISDVAAWHRQCKNTRFSLYAEHIEKSCGGDPNKPGPAHFEAVHRSSLTFLSNAGSFPFPIDINTGIHDGHTGSVPVRHAFEAFNAVAKLPDVFQEEEIDYIVKKEKVWPGCPIPEQDPSFGDIALHVRRQSGNVRLTIFEGGHDILINTGLAWLKNQRKAQSPIWNAEMVSAKSLKLTR
ncbi:MAG: prolyl oligopeptidase family serine peptidase [Lentisphaeria bacterium]